MAAIGLEDIVYSSVVSLLAAIQLTRFAKKVGFARQKFKIFYPQMTGDPNFERVLRAQQNCLEFFPIFMVCLWTSTLFFNQAASAVIGLIYMYSRHLYVIGYCKSVEGRLPGFKLGVKCVLLMSAMAVAGFVNTIVRMHTDVDLGVMVLVTVKHYLKMDTVL